MRTQVLVSVLIIDAAEYLAAIFLLEFLLRILTEFTPSVAPTNDVCPDPFWINAIWEPVGKLT